MALFDLKINICLFFLKHPEQAEGYEQAARWFFALCLLLSVPRVPVLSFNHDFGWLFLINPM